MDDETVVEPWTDCSCVFGFSYTLKMGPWEFLQWICSLKVGPWSVLLMICSSDLRSFFAEK